MFIPVGVLVAFIVGWYFFSDSGADRRAERDFRRNEERERIARVQSMTPDEREASRAAFEKMQRELDPNSPEAKARASKYGAGILIAAVVLIILLTEVGACPRHPFR